jgi:hypothetical protein
LVEAGGGWRRPEEGSGSRQANEGGRRGVGLVEGDSGERLRGGLVEADRRERPLSKLVGYNIGSPRHRAAQRPCLLLLPSDATPEINVLGRLALPDLWVREFLKKVRLLVKVWQRRCWICCPTARRRSSFFAGKNFL